MNFGSDTQPNDIKSELSYAYFHAVASRIGGAVSQTPRLQDNMGVDAILKIRGKFADNPIRTDFTIEIQLKSTSKPVEIGKNGKISFNKLKRETYDLFRSPDRPTQRLVILFCLPENPEDWLHLTEDELILRKCAYWVDLFGAPEQKAKCPTIYFPKNQLFTPDQLKNVILKTYAEKKEFHYES